MDIKKRDFLAGMGLAAGLAGAAVDQAVDGARHHAADPVGRTLSSRGVILTKGNDRQPISP